MKIFLSWSGERSLMIAEALRDWLPDLIAHFEPWLSSKDTEKGARWAEDLAQQLENTDIGIICLTPENLSEPWILFESGALAKAIEKPAVCAYLFDLHTSDLKGPLVQFQATQAIKADTYSLINTLNNKLDHNQLSSERLGRVFEQWWPVLEKKLGQIPKTTGQKQSKRSERDILEELTDLVRQQTKKTIAQKEYGAIRGTPFHQFFDVPEVQRLANTVKLPGDVEDENETNWAEGLNKNQERHPIEGIWGSRWYEESKFSRWCTGLATVVRHKDYFFILHTDEEVEYLMLAKTDGANRLLGYHYGLKDSRDKSAWVGLIVNENRIDGEWARGRWDLRR